MKKETKVDFLRRWGIQDPVFLRSGFSSLRYKHPPEKGVYWYYFSRFVRMRDVIDFGTCISCDEIISFDTSQAGHFMPAKDCGRDLLFDPRNVNAECARCNAWDETHLLGYADNLDKRYGEGTADSLRARRLLYKARKEPLKDWNREEYAAKILALPGYPHPLVDFHRESAILEKI